LKISEVAAACTATMSIVYLVMVTTAGANLLSDNVQLYVCVLALIIISRKRVERKAVALDPGLRF
jgi:hypothetical protein